MTGSPSVIRKMQLYDIEEVGQIWLTASIQAHDFVPAEFWESDLKNMTGDILPDPVTEGYVFESADRIEGFLTLGGNFVGCLFVRPEMQGRGIGTELINHAKQLRAELDLTVYQENVRATRFYEREGFRMTGKSTCPHTGCAEYRMRWVDETR